jgi:hypothetical protein
MCGSPTRRRPRRGCPRLLRLIYLHRLRSSRFRRRHPRQNLRLLRLLPIGVACRRPLCPASLPPPPAPLLPPPRQHRSHSRRRRPKGLATQEGLALLDLHQKRLRHLALLLRRASRSRSHLLRARSPTRRPDISVATTLRATASRRAMCSGTSAPPRATRTPT